jgi:hypothetical protein
LSEPSSTKAYYPPLARTLEYIFLAALYVGGLLSLAILSLVIMLRWPEVPGIENMEWQAMLSAVLFWLSVATALAALVTRSRRRKRSLGGVVFRIASSISLACFTGAVGAAILQANQSHRPLNTEADVRPRLERLLKQRVRGSPKFSRIGNLSQQIRNVRISGPSMTFEPETTRYVKFDLDTGCGRVIEVSAVLDAGDADILGSVDRNNCQP